MVTGEEKKGKVADLIGITEKEKLKCRHRHFPDLATSKAKSFITLFTLIYDLKLLS